MEEVMMIITCVGFNDTLIPALRDFSHEFILIFAGFDAHYLDRKHFILKSIIINNLYGVDIMEEAIEICKLRLFLKMVAQIEDVQQIEPPAFPSYDEGDILNLDAIIPIPEPCESGTIRVKLICEEPSEPMPVEDP